MKKIYILVIKSYLGPLIMTFFIALFILVMQFLWKYIDDLVGKGLEWYTVTELMFYAASTFVPLALPLAILLSSLMTFGNLGEHYELIAMKAAGISLKKIMMPLIILSFLISIMALYFSNNVLPIANLKFRTLLYDIRKHKLAFNIKEGVFYNGLDGYVIRVGKKDKDGSTLYDVLIYDHTDRRGNINVTAAKTGKMESTPDSKFLIFTLYDGCNYSEKIDKKGHRVTRPFQRTSFDEETRSFDLSEFNMARSDESLFKEHYMMLNLKQLDYGIDSLQGLSRRKKETFNTNFNRNYHFYTKFDTNNLNFIDTTKKFSTNLIKNFEPEDQEAILETAISSVDRIKTSISYQIKDIKAKEEYVTKHKVAWNEKFTLSIACFILFFIGAPLGAIIRKGGLGLPVVISVFFFVIFHIVSIIGKKYSESGIWEPYLGMWLASAVLLPIGIFLTYKATTDSPLLDSDAWRKVFFKIFRKT